MRAAGSGTSGAAGLPAPPPRGGKADVIDYEVHGSEMQYVVITLDPGETCIAEAGGMMFMTPGIRWRPSSATPPPSSAGFLGKVLTAGKRSLTGESLFMTTFTAGAHGRDKVAFAAPYPARSSRCTSTSSAGN
jgi:uncharacterized protein (AIM24 family)